jgi:UDP-N-acetylmuramoylalanine--D-glutamate ligase
MTRVFEGERAVVVGYGVSGRAAADVLAAEGASVKVSEARQLDQLDAAPDGTAARDAASAAGIDLLAGGHRPEHLEGASLVVVSPGVQEGSPIVAWARRRDLPVWSELELGARLCRVPFVAITGTNGKTTTTEMVAAIMRASGLSARACGNVGYPFALAARAAELDALAVECSSFQLAFQETFHPRVSALLNLAPDHLDWHGSFERYTAAKARIYLNQAGEDVHVGNQDDREGARVSRGAPCVVRWFRWGKPEQAEVGMLDGMVMGGDGVELGRPLGIGRGFLTDAAAAAAATRAFGLEDGAIRSALEAFVPLPHRGTVVAEVAGIRFVDDSKATNPHAALAALDGMSNTVLIAGGQAKGVDLSPLAQAAPRLTNVVVIGEAGPDLARVFDGLVPVSFAGSIEEAVDLARAAASPGGTVLLAPACASQDMFRDYRERGERFAAAARRLASEGTLGVAPSRSTRGDGVA